MELCIEHDINISPDIERAEYSLLLQESEDLLERCTKTWRLSAPFKNIVYLELIAARFGKATNSVTNIDLKDLKDAVFKLDECLREKEVQFWTISDVRTSIITRKASYLLLMLPLSSVKP